MAVIHAWPATWGLQTSWPASFSGVSKKVSRECPESVPRSVKKGLDSGALFRHSQDTFWTLRSLGPEGYFVGHCFWDTRGRRARETPLVGRAGWQYPDLLFLGVLIFLGLFLGNGGVKKSLVFWVVFLGFYLNTKEKKIRVERSFGQ